MQSDSAPNLTFAVRGDLPATMREKLKAVLLASARDADSASYFKLTGFRGFEPTGAGDLSGLAALKPVAD